VAPEADAAVDFDDWDAEVKLLSQGVVLVDVDALDQETVSLKGLLRHVTEVAVLTRVKNRFL
jgi:hypothetical protein